MMDNNKNNEAQNSSFLTKELMLRKAVLASDGSHPSESSNTQSHNAVDAARRNLRKENIFLIGLMGAGKTTLGRAVARRLGYTFIDSDHEIEKSTGVNIPIIFELEGEEGFRLREAWAINKLTQRKKIVLATGGGVILRSENVKRLKENGTLFYLHANPKNLWLRTKKDKNRPLLQTANPLKQLESLYQFRDPIYRECADFIVETGPASIQTLINSIIKKMHDE